MTAVENAVEMARAGFPVFPLWGVIERDGEMWDAKTGERATKESGKHPKTYGENWQTVASTDEAVIREWFEKDPTINYGVCTGNGWLVVDCDSEEATDDFIFAFETMHLDDDGDPIELNPFVVKTGRGTHFYWRGTSRNKVRLREGVDVRGDGGYVVGPGCRSWTGAWYKYASGSLETADKIPDWLIRSGEREQSDRPFVGGTTEAPRIPNGARNDVLFRMAANMIAVGIDKSTVKTTITWVNEHQLDEPLTMHELETSIFYTIDKPEFQYGASISSLLAMAEYKMVSGLFEVQEDALSGKEFFLKEDMALLPKPVWLVKDRIPARGVMQMHGRSYTGKTFVAIDLVMSMMNGLPWLGMDFRLDANREAEAKDCVLYVLTEGLFDFRQRLDGWCRRKGGDYDRLIVLAEKPYDLAKLEDWDRLFLAMESDERVSRMANRLGMIVIDTQSNAIWANENDNNEMSKVAQRLRQMSTKVRAPILLIHHDPYGGDDNDRGNRIGGRGASSFGAAMDVVIALDPARRDGDFMSLTFSKVKAARSPDHPTMFRLATVELADGVTTAVCDDEGVNEVLGNGPEPLLDRIVEMLREQTDLTMRWGQVYAALGFTGTDPRVRVLREQCASDPRFTVEKGRGPGNYFTISLNL